LLVQRRRSPKSTVNPDVNNDVGSPNRILREEVDGKVIIRTGRRLPGISPIAGVHFPIAVVRMAVGDAYGAKQWREGEAGSADEAAFRTERVTRSVCHAVSEYAFRTAARMRAKVYGGPKWTVSPVYEGMLKEEMDAAAARHPDVAYQPVLIDATYAGLLSGAADAPLAIPALNRDVVRQLRHGADRADSETASEQTERASRAIYESALEAVGAGVKTPDLGGHAGTTEFTDNVIERVRNKLEIWSSLGSAA
jgi:isocitrate dehydrogenase (NAD+)